MPDDIDISLEDEQSQQHPMYSVEAVIAANELSGRMVKQRKFRAAKIALCRALTAAPNNHELLGNLSSVMWSLRAYEDAEALAKMALAMNTSKDKKGLTSALTSLGNACTSLRNYDLALKAYDAVIEQSETNFDARWNRTLLKLLLGDYEEGWKYYHLRIDRDKPEKLKDAALYKSPLWSGESLEGKSIHVLHDQGYGDTILYSRYLLGLTRKAKKVYMSTSPVLVPLLHEYSEAGVEFVHHNTPNPDVDYHTYVGTLPMLFGTTRDTVPVDPGFILKGAIKAREGRLNVYIEPPKVNPNLKIGLCWSGRPDFSRNDERMVPFRLLLSLAENPHFWIYSLQCGPQASEIEEHGVESFINNLEPQLEQKGWMATATAMLQLDVVVTCCTSIAHLAGALGVPCFVMLNTEPYWIWGHEGQSTPWYPDSQLFRQNPQRRGDWTGVVEEVRNELMRLLVEKSGQEVPEVRLG